MRTLKSLCVLFERASVGMELEFGHLYSSDKNFEKLVNGWFSIIFHRLLIDFA